MNRNQWMMLGGAFLLLVGLYFWSKSQGQEECKDKPDSTGMNKWIGILSAIFGIALVLAGYIMNSYQPPPEYTEYAPTTETTTPTA